MPSSNGQGAEAPISLFIDEIDRNVVD